MWQLHLRLGDAHTQRSSNVNFYPNFPFLCLVEKQSDEHYWLELQRGARARACVCVCVCVFPSLCMHTCVWEYECMRLVVGN